MSLLGGIGNALKKVAKGVASVIDNPVTRAIGSVNPLVGAVTSTAGLIAGNMQTTQYGGAGQFLPGPGGVSYGLPSGFAFDPRPTTTPGGAIDLLTPDFLVPPTGGSCTPRVLRSGKVRYPRHRADGTCYFPRRMNPLNPRAARRAIRRIKAVRRITRDIERSLPKVSTRRRAA